MGCAPTTMPISLTLMKSPGAYSPSRITCWMAAMRARALRPPAAAPSARSSHGAGAAYRRKPVIHLLDSFSCLTLSSAAHDACAFVAATRGPDDGLYPLEHGGHQVGQHVHPKLRVARAAYAPPRRASRGSRRRRTDRVTVSYSPRSCSRRAVGPLLVGQEAQHGGLAACGEGAALARHGAAGAVPCSPHHPSARRRLQSSRPPPRLPRPRRRPRSRRPRASAWPRRYSRRRHCRRARWGPVLERGRCRHRAG